MTELVPQVAGPSETSSSQDHPSPSFEELAMPLFDSVYNLARWLTQNPSEAEDLVQETFLKALRGFTSFQLGTNFRAWIFRIMRNTFLSSRTKLQWRNEVAIVGDDDLAQLPESSGTPESLLIDRCGIDAIRRAIEGLPLAYREVIILCDVEQASYREIAAVLSIPIGTVMSRLARARKILQKTALQHNRQSLNVGWQSTRGLQNLPVQYKSDYPQCGYSPMIGNTWRPAHRIRRTPKLNLNFHHSGIKDVEVS